MPRVGRKETNMARKIDVRTLRSEGKVVVGAFGLGKANTSGDIICRPEDLEAVRAAYDAIEDDDLSPGVLDEVIAAGGEHVVGL